MIPRLSVGAATAVLLLASAPIAHAAPKMDPAVSRVMQGYIAAWNSADASAIASNFTDDGDFINPTGFYAQGRSAIQAFYSQAFSMGYAGSRATFTPRMIRTIASGAIVIDGEWGISGAKDAAGQPRPEERGIATAVLVKTNTGWRLAALREHSSANGIKR